MESAINCFAALSQPTRLQALQLLIRHEPQGLAVGEVAGQLAVPPNTMSAHLAVLARAGWVTSRRRSRLVIYRAELAQLQAVLRFLSQDCCAGHPEVCAALAVPITGCETEQT